MAVFDLYSKRQKAARGETPDVFVYDEFPQQLRIQMVHVWYEAFGQWGKISGSHQEHCGEAFKAIVDILRKEYGVFELTSRGRNTQDELVQFFLQESDTEKLLDVVELVGVALNVFVSKFDYKYSSNAEDEVQASINEINARFKEQGLGFEFIDREIVRIDSKYLHAEAVKPALEILRDKAYAGADQEFRSAFGHYRVGKNKEALTDCLKAFESAMKAICDKRGWAFSPGASAKELISVMFAQGIIPSFWQTQINALRTLLESSVPTGRNKLGGHGQGSVPVVVPDHFVSYMLHMTASTLVFLVNAEKSLP